MSYPASGRATLPAAPLPLLTVLLLLIALAGCGRGGRSDSGAASSNLKSTSKAAKAPVVNVLEDEAMLRGSQAVIGGKVQNISGQRLENLTIELELNRRDDGQKTLKQVEVSPAAITPGDEGRYNLTVSNREWSGWKILRIRAGSHTEELPFTVQPGARRPPERTPPGKTVVVERPKSKDGGFINTPDNPDPIR